MSKTTILRRPRQRARAPRAPCRAARRPRRTARVVPESAHRYSTCDGGVGRVDAVGDAAGAQDADVGIHPLPARVGEDRGDVARLEAERHAGRARSRATACRPRPGHAAPDAEFLLAHRRPVARALHRVPEHLRDRLARQRARRTCRSRQRRGWRRSACRHQCRLHRARPRHRHVFFFFQRRSPRTPSSFMPR